MAAINRTITIPAGGTDSPVVEALELAPAVSVLILPPGTLSETVNVVVSDTPTGTFVVLQTDGSDVVLTAAKALQITVLSGCYWKLRSTTPVAAGGRAFGVIVNRIGEPFLP